MLHKMKVVRVSLLSLGIVVGGGLAGNSKVWADKDNYVDAKEEAWELELEQFDNQEIKEAQQKETQTDYMKAFMDTGKGSPSFIKLNGHTFIINPATVVKLPNQKNTITVTGTLEHCLTGRPNDMVDYKIVKENGVLTKFEIKISQGGWVAYVAPEFASLTSEYISINKEGLCRLANRIGKAIDGNWEKQRAFY